nr:sugar transferase [uncultured Dysosmobacter sp.]
MIQQLSMREKHGCQTLETYSDSEQLRRMIADDSYDGSSFTMGEIQQIGEINRKINLAHANEVSKPVCVRNSFYTRHIKRWLDICISLAALIVFLPVNLVLWVATYLDVGKPVIFRQARTGKNKRTFEIIKFRNMTNETDENGDLLPPEQRVTKWGRFVRRTSLDELLNFWLVLKGDMSIIGPRPLHDFYTPWMSDRHAARFAVRPGLDCPALDARRETASWQGRFENDVWYVENCSLALDFQLLFRLFLSVFCQNRRREREVGESGTFIGYDAQGKAVSSQNIPENVIQYILRNNHYVSPEEVR